MERALSAPSLAVPHSKAGATTLGIPLFVLATVFASLSIIVGLIWDISWHMSIGRDGLFSPPHLAIYLGAVIAGVFSGYQVLQTTFAGSATKKAESVKFWSFFYAPLGALFCIWGALAMLTSAPFDDWWHNTYGLDVTILSPPHTVLALGMMMIQFGAMIGALALQNRESSLNLDAKAQSLRNSRLRLLFVIAAGLLLVSLYTLASEYLGRHDMHHSLFYQIGSLLFPLYLVAVARSSKLKWAATITAAVYMLMMALMVWILPLFPAEPKLGPILTHFDHYQPFDFPLLLVIPALGVDWVMNRFDGKNQWLLAVMLSAAFLLLFFAVQWPFGDFMMSPYARNWFFGAESWYFGSNPDWEYRYSFMPWHTHTGWDLVKGLLVAFGIGILSSRIGLAWGNWMKKVQR